MPELPDLTIYIEALDRRIVGRTVEEIRIRNPFFLRTFAPPVRNARSRAVVALRRIGKRVVIELEGALFLVIHLMVAGRFHWKEHGAKLAGKAALAAIDFPNGTLLVTEAGTKKRASLHVVEGVENLGKLDPGGLEVIGCEAAIFAATLRRENHTLKRALTDPALFSGIGNAYSDEILHAARLSPLKLTSKLTDQEAHDLHRETQRVLLDWISRLRQATGEDFPEKVTAFRDGMSVHGRYGKPCPVCGTSIQRIVYAENECNYCPRCQTQGKLLADRGLSRLLREDWPRTIEDLEARRQR